MVNVTPPLVPPPPPPPPVPGLGRLVQFDPASRDFQIRTLLTAEGIVKPRSYTWAAGPRLNQGSTGTCVGHAVAGELGARPVRWPANSALAFVIYELACRRDIWTQNDNGDRSFGTSVLAAMQVMKELGFIPEYRWAGAGSGSAIEDQVLAIGYKGPVVNGTIWLNSMFSVATDGHIIVEQSSGIAGGHAYLSNQVSVVWKGISLPDLPTMTHVDRTKSRNWITNSWGEWGIDGRGWFTFDEMDWLLEQEGEGAIPVLRQRTT